MFSFAATKRLNILNHSRKDFFSSFIPFIKCYIGTVVTVWSSKSYTPSNHIMISVYSILHKTNCYWDGSVPDRCQCVMALGPLEASLGPIVCTWRRKSSLKIPMFKKFLFFSARFARNCPFQTQTCWKWIARDLFDIPLNFETQTLINIFLPKE